MEVTKFGMVIVSILEDPEYPYNAFADRVEIARY